MFTGLIKKGRWSYMFLAAVATLAVAALATLCTTRSAGDMDSQLKRSHERTLKTGSYMPVNGTTTRFIN